MNLEELEIVFTKNIKRFTKAIDFILQHRHLKTNVERVLNAKALINQENAKEKIRLVFIDALSSSGSRTSNLTLNGAACRYFNSKIERLESTPQVSLEQFFSCFDLKIQNMTSLHRFLYDSDKLENFGKKKAALFLYKLDWIQNQPDANQKIFSNYNVSNTDLILPIDDVITFILNKLFNLKNDHRLDSDEDFDLLNSFFKSKMGENFILIEDFWFWGYFTTKGKKEKREFEFNPDKFDSSDILIPTKQNKRLFLDFIRILNEKS